MKKYLQIASLIGFVAIILGAFGAHALKDKLTPEALESFQTGVRYMMYHVIVLLFVNTTAVFSVSAQKIISWLFFFGIICFSGSIFAISVLNVSAKNIWFVTPLGGLLLMLGWLYMCISFQEKKSTKTVDK